MTKELATTRNQPKENTERRLRLFIQAFEREGYEAIRCFEIEMTKMSGERFDDDTEQSSRFSLAIQNTVENAKLMLQNQLSTFQGVSFKNAFIAGSIRLVTLDYNTYLQTQKELLLNEINLNK